MSEQPTVRRSDLAARLRNTLEALERRVQTNVAAMAIWERHFTAANRKSLGDDPYRAWKNSGRTAGMWAIIREVSFDQAIVEVAHALDWVDTETSTELLESLGGGKKNISKPRWLRDKRELWFEGEVVRRIRNASRAKNIIAILSAFEESGWPHQIDDPITAGGASDTRRRAIESLNQGLTRIHFMCGGDGTSFQWEILPQASRRKSVRKVAKKKSRRKRS